jgi:flagellum-specific ATP synthase
VGRVNKVIGLVVEATGLNCGVGDVCEIKSKNGKRKKSAEVIGIKNKKILLMPYSELNGVQMDDEVTPLKSRFGIKVGDSLRGRIINALGDPIDGKGPIESDLLVHLYNTPPSPLKRSRIREPLATGIKAIDTFSTVGRGQRIGIFSGSGVGKSVLMGMICRFAEADINVIALIGERGREVREFIERDLGEEGLKKSVVVAVTSDEASILRVKGGLTATTIAEYFREKGLSVLLLMDSITRIAVAQREIGLAAGEPPTTRGYTPSVFTFLPRLLERAGTSQRGSITGIYTVLVEGDDINEPVADAVRSILDGHIVLSRKLASINQYPAIDPLHSISRVMKDIVTEKHYQYSREILDLISTYQDVEDLINLGAYNIGSNKKIDRSIKVMPEVSAFLKQRMNERVTFDETIDMMEAVHAGAAYEEVTKVKDG